MPLSTIKTAPLLFTCFPVFFAALFGQPMPSENRHRLSFWSGYGFPKSSDINAIEQASQLATERQRHRQGGFMVGLSYGCVLNRFVLGVGANALSIYDYEYRFVSDGGLSTTLVQLTNSLFPLHAAARYNLPFGFHAGLGAGYAYSRLSGVANQEEVDIVTGGFSWEATLGYEYRISQSIALSLTGRYFSYTRSPATQIFIPSLEIAWSF